MARKGEFDPVTLTRMCAVSSDIVYVAASPDENEAGSAFTLLGQYNKGNWEFLSFDFWTESLALYKAPDFDFRVLFVLSEEGRIVNINNLAAEEWIIPEDRSSEFKKRYKEGRFAEIRQIGRHMYAVGSGGQNFRRDDDGTWQPLDLRIFDPYVDPDWAMEISEKRQKEKGGWTLELRTEDSEDGREHRRRRALLSRNTILWGIDGVDENDIYLCGPKGVLLHWNGSTMREMLPGRDISFASVLVETPDRIWVSARGGLLAVGNSRDGFEVIYGEGREWFGAMALYRGKLYLASTANKSGLFTYDNTGFREVRIPLAPAPLDIHSVQAVDDVLWVMGTKDLLRFDGKEWQRIDHPVNGPRK